MLRALEIEIVVQTGAGQASGFDDASYEAVGARVESEAAAVLGADLVLKVQPPSASEIGALREGAALIGFMRPLDEPQTAAQLAARGVTSFSRS